MMTTMMMCRYLIIFLCRLEITGVSAWVRSPLPLQSYRNNVNNGMVTAEERFVSPKSVVYSTTVEDTDTSIKTTTTTTTYDTDTDNPSVVPQQQQQQSSRSRISMPSIQYTVPGMKRGWKNSDTGSWMDEDGPRNGPPQNYWRQQSDEKLYRDSMQLVQDLLQLNQFRRSSQGIISNTTAAVSSSSCNKDTTTADNIERNDIICYDLINGLVQPLEKSNSVRRPFLNRLILGDWAPIVRDGKVIAAGKGSSSSTTTSINYCNEIDVPYCFHIQRTAGQKLAPKTHYGSFDEHLDAEEEIAIQQLVATTSPSSFSSIDGNTIVTTSSGVVRVSSENENRLVKGFSSDNDLCMGGITYVSKYIMIMRREQQQEKDKKNNNAGSVIEIWMRVDPNV
jgi:hypothetical protein